MKKYNIYVLVFFVMSLFSVSCNESGSNGDLNYEEWISARVESMNIPRPKDSYNYPVYPGTAEWAKLTTSQELLDACQVPVDILKNQSTQAVIQAIWEYPFFIEPLHRHLYQQDFDSIFQPNNAYKELIKRTDAGQLLFERLVLVNPSVPEAKYEPQALELLISQPLFLSQLDAKAKKTVVNVALKNDSLRQKDITTSNIFRNVTWLLIGRTIINAGYEPFIEVVNNDEQLETFFKTSEIHFHTEEESDIFIQLILFQSNNFIK
jgi:hypothetical protein